MRTTDGSNCQHFLVSGDKSSSQRSSQFFVNTSFTTQHGQRVRKPHSLCSIFSCETRSHCFKSDLMTTPSLLSLALHWCRWCNSGCADLSPPWFATHLHKKPRSHAWTSVGSAKIVIAPCARYFRADSCLIKAIPRGWSKAQKNHQNYFTSTDLHHAISKQPRWHRPRCVCIRWRLLDLKDVSLISSLASSTATICAGLIRKSPRKEPCPEASSPTSGRF